MAALSQGSGVGERQAGSSPRPKGRENAKETLCRNVTIYGHCRYEDKGCAFSHDLVKHQPQQAQTESIKKRFNVDSPSFTPTTLPVNGTSAPSKGPGISPRAASAAPFRPKNYTPAPSSVTSSTASSLSLKPYNPNAPDFLGPDLPDFLPPAYNSLSTGESSTNFPSAISYEQQYSETPSLSASNPTESDLSVGLYASDTTGFAQSLYPSQLNQSLSNQPLQHHLYANLGPLTTSLQPNQRHARDSFLPEDLRQRLHKKSEDILRNFGSSYSFPPYHTLTPLLENSKLSKHFPGYESSVFKAIDSRDGRTYCLRRIYPFKVDDPAAEERFRTVRNTWRRVRNSNVVSFHEIYTNTEAFGDSSLIVVTDYHPESLTLQQHLSSIYSPGASRRTPQYLPEPLLWKYVVQLSNALRAIHAQGMSARLIAADKILVTDEDRIRFNGCAIADILEPLAPASTELQRADLVDLGKLVLFLSAPFAKIRPQDHFDNLYSPHLREAVAWLLGTGPDRKIYAFLKQIGPATMDCFSAAESDNDMLQAYLNRELENSRFVRLLMKLNMVNERPEHAKDPMWDDLGPRAKIQLFRDYVFHEVDEQGRPVQDMGHILACLNKLDVGLDEKIKLETRDGKSILLVSYKEMKQLIEGAFQDMIRRSRA